MNSTTNIPVLKTPENRGSLTINHIDKITDSEKYGEFAQQWALSVWNSWSKLHEFIKNEIKAQYDK